MSYTINIYSDTGKVLKKFEFDPTRFSEEKINLDLVHEYLLYQQSNARQLIASTKNRGEVAGSGRKLYRQKGTGRARVGDKNSPIRRGGGVAFGPTAERNYTKSMNKKTRKSALSAVISIKLKENSILGLSLGEMKPNTKSAIKILSSLPQKEKKILLVMDQKNEGIEKSFRNIPGMKIILVDYLNPYDLMNSNQVVFMDGALQGFGV